MDFLGPSFRFTLGCGHKARDAHDPKEKFIPLTWRLGSGPIKQASIICNCCSENAFPGVLAPHCIETYWMGRNFLDNSVKLH
jgi:hypothetical protein